MKTVLDSLFDLVPLELESKVSLFKEDVYVYYADEFAEIEDTFGTFCLIPQDKRRDLLDVGVHVSSCVVVSLGLKLECPLVKRFILLNGTWWFIDSLSENYSKINIEEIKSLYDEFCSKYLFDNVESEKISFACKVWFVGARLEFEMCSKGYEASNFIRVFAGGAMIEYDTTLIALKIEDPYEKRKIRFNQLVKSLVCTADLLSIKRDLAEGLSSNLVLNQQEDETIKDLKWLKEEINSFPSESKIKRILIGYLLFYKSLKRYDADI